MVAHTCNCSPWKTKAERKMRIELGYGLENKISMSSLEYIRDNDILPYYKQLNYQSGIARGTYQLANIVAQAEGVSIKTQGVCPSQTYSSASDERHPWWIWPFAIIMSIFCPRRRRFDYGGFGGFGGGGGFGGSGCSGSW